MMSRTNNSLQSTWTDVKHSPQARDEKVGLVLGGGGSRCCAHIGVLQVLVREKVAVDLMVGTSAGGIVGVLFALGYTPEQLLDRLDRTRGAALIGLKRLQASARQRWLQDLLATALEGRTFADLTVPTALMAVDLLSGAEVTLTEGPLMPAVLATCAAPGIFPPVELNGMQLVDRGVIDSLATHAARGLGADRVIAADVYPSLERDNPWKVPVAATLGLRLPLGLSRLFDCATTPHTTSVIWRADRVMTCYLHEQRLRAHPPDLLLRPKVDAYGTFDLSDLNGPVLAGVTEAERHLAKLKDITRAP